MKSLSRIQKLLALAASCFTIGQPHEGKAALIRASEIAAAHGVDLLPLADDAGVSLDCLVPWTEEATPANTQFTCAATIKCDDGTTLLVFDSVEGAGGVLVERLAGEDRDFRLLNRGFWRDHEIVEAICFARDAWGC